MWEHLHAWGTQVSGSALKHLSRTDPRDIVHTSLEELGKQGWRLVAVLDPEPSDHYHFYFERERVQAETDHCEP